MCLELCFVNGSSFSVKVCVGKSTVLNIILNINSGKSDKVLIVFSNSSLNE